MFLRRLPFFTLSAIACLGCTDKELPISPKMVPTTAHLQIVPPSMTDAALPTFFGSPAFSINLPTYDDTVLVELRLSGTISVTAQPDAPLQGYTGPLDGAGEFVGSVYQQCYAKVQFAYDTVGRSGPAPCFTTPSPKSLWVDTLRVRGHGTASRNGGVPEAGSCLHGPCHVYDGEQLVSVTPLNALLQISATGTTHVPGGTITFAASVSPDSMHHIAVPLKMLSWQWTPTGGSRQTVACSTPVNPCSVAVQEDGSMKVTGLANGTEQFASVGVTLVTWTSPSPCAGPALTRTPHPISSPFGKPRPQIGENYPHTGDDYSVPAGDTIFSPRAGTVAAMNPNSKTAGKLIIIESDTRYSWFEHLSSFNPNLHEGSSVSVGTWLGLVGSTGTQSHGPHLHFEEHSKDWPMTYTSGPNKGHAPRESLKAPCTF